MHTHNTPLQNKPYIEIHSRAGRMMLAMMRSLTMIILMVMVMSVGLLVKPVFANNEFVIEPALGFGNFNGLGLSENFNHEDFFESASYYSGYIVSGDVQFLKNRGLPRGGALGAYTGVHYSAATGDLGRSGDSGNIRIPIAVLFGNNFEDGGFSFTFGLGVSLNFAEIRSGFGNFSMFNFGFGLPKNWSISLRLQSVTYNMPYNNSNNNSSREDEVFTFFTESTALLAFGYRMGWTKN